MKNKKALALLALALVAAAEWTFINSFYSVPYTHGDAVDTSAVIVAKAKYVFMRANILITAGSPGPVVLLFSNGTRQEIEVKPPGFTTSEFDVLLPSTGSYPGDFSVGNPNGILLSTAKPIYLAVIANVTENFFTDGVVPAWQSSLIDVFWIRVQGNARIDITGYGVAI